MKGVGNCNIWHKRNPIKDQSVIPKRYPSHHFQSVFKGTQVSPEGNQYYIKTINTKTSKITCGSASFFPTENTEG